jgi:hypothetical protein
LRGLGDSPNLQPLEAGKDTAVPAHPVSLRDAEAPIPMAPRVTPDRILGGILAKVFDGKTNNPSLIVQTLQTMPFGTMRVIWQTIANVIAKDCTDANGHVDVERLKVWTEFCENTKNFGKVPFCFISLSRFMRLQILAVGKCLLDNRDNARSLLNAASTTVSPHGQSILAAISRERKVPLNPIEAILESLFTPHRQYGFPTCEIDSNINAENHNHPERLIKIYIQMLSNSQFTFPSGYAVQLQPIVDGFITVDLTNGGEGRNDVFEDIASGDPTKIAEQIAEWQQAGIGYDPAKKYELKIPVYNMNDILFAHSVLATNFGNKEINCNDEYGTMLVYAGYGKYDNIYLPTIKVDGPNFLDGMTKLKEEARAQQQLGHHYMRVVTKPSASKSPAGNSTPKDLDDHAENIDIDALLALDLGNMETGKAYPIGDRNMAIDLPRLAVRKMDGTGDGTPPTFQFGTWICGGQFEPEDISQFKVYMTEIKVREATYWERLKLQDSSDTSDCFDSSDF